MGNLHRVRFSQLPIRDPPDRIRSGTELQERLCLGSPVRRGGDLEGAVTKALAARGILAQR
jgi:hypothetical protein